MDRDDASSAEMRRPPPNDPLALDDASVERLLSGTLPAASAPPGYAGVARLLAATVAPPTPRELAGQAAVLAELRAVTRGRRAASPARPGRPRRRRAGLAVVVVVGALATGGVAAATGHLPGPVREAARSVLGPAGGAASPSPGQPAAGTVTASAGAAGSASTAGSGPRPGPAAAGPAAGPALDGLCRAFQAGNGGERAARLDATAFQELATAAGGPGQVAAFCEDLLAADTKAKGPKEAKPKDPPDDAGPGPVGPPADPGGSGDGAGGGSGSGGGGNQGQSSTTPAPSPPGRG
jgi:hypothetical protein